MNIRWKFTLGRVVVWVAAEIIFSMLGVDDLADYSEFLWEKSATVSINQTVVMK